MRGSAVLAVAAGLALGGAAFSLPASAGVFSTAARAELPASSVVHVKWWGDLGFSADTWHSMDKADRHDLRVQWRQARKAAKKGDGSLMSSLLAQYSSSSSASGTTSTTTTASSSSTGTGTGGSLSNVSSSTSSLLSAISTSTATQSATSQALVGTKRQAGGLPGSNYLALQSYGVTDTSGLIKLSSGTMTSWLEHSTLLSGFDANGNVTFESLKAGAHIIGAIGGSNIKSISVGANNAISFMLVDPTKDADFSYVLQFADGSTRTVSGNPIYANYQKISGQNFVNNVSGQSFSIPFSEIFANIDNPGGNTLSIAGIGSRDGVTNLVIDKANQVVTGILTGGSGKLGITVTDGKSFATITKLINKIPASPT